MGIVSGAGVQDTVQGLNVRDWNHLRLSRRWGWGPCDMRVNVRGLLNEKCFRVANFLLITW